MSSAHRLALEPSRAAPRTHRDPFYTYVHYHGRKWEEYGPEKMEWMFAHRSFLDYGIPVAPASDYVPGPYEPMMAIQSMVTRKDPDGIKEIPIIRTVVGGVTMHQQG